MPPCNIREKGSLLVQYRGR